MVLSRFSGTSGPEDPTDGATGLHRDHRQSGVSVDKTFSAMRQNKLACLFRIFGLAKLSSILIYLAQKDNRIKLNEVIKKAYLIEALFRCSTRGYAPCLTCNQ